MKNQSSALFGSRQMRIRADDTNVEDMGDLLTKNVAGIQPGCYHQLQQFRLLQGDAPVVKL